MPNENAGQEPVKKPEEVVENKQPIATEVDPEVEMAKLLAENKKLAEERENYRKGMLKAKGKLPEEVEPEETEERTRKIVAEMLAQTNFATAQQRLEEQALKLARENKELKKSLANRTGITTTGQPTSQDIQAVRDTSISPEKEAALLARFTGTEEQKKEKLAKWKQNRFGKK